MGEPKIPNKSSSAQSDLESNDLGRPDTLRYNILTYVLGEEYDRAINMIKDFIERDSEYPSFKLKIERYSLHAIDLIYAIRTKRNFPGLSGLTRTKQQELRDKFKEHFGELRVIMKKIENCLEELRLDDVKSTKIVVRAFWFSLVTVFLSALFIEFFQGLGGTVTTVINERSDVFINFLLEKIF
jgi:hypothetical protein